MAFSPHSEDASEIEIEAAPATLGQTVAHVERAEEAVESREDSAGRDDIIESDVVPVLPDVAELEGSADIRRQEREVADASQCAHRQQSHVLSPQCVLTDAGEIQEATQPEQTLDRRDTREGRAELAAQDEAVALVRERAQVIDLGLVEVVVRAETLSRAAPRQHAEIPVTRKVQVVELVG